MADNTAIEWTDATVNFWWGCTKVSPGCDRCYAETHANRFSPGHWGPGAPRKEIAGAHDLMRRLDRLSARRIADGFTPLKVFTQSMSDIFDNEAPGHWRDQAFETIERCPHLRAQMLTKRIGNVAKMVPARWQAAWPAHVGLMITVVDQPEAARDVPKLLGLKSDFRIPWVGLSIEPLLGPIDLGNLRRPDGTYWDVFETEGYGPNYWTRPGLDWVVVGGESGRGARPMHPDWARSLRDQCAAAGVPFFFKQWGAWRPSGGYVEGRLEPASHGVSTCGALSPVVDLMIGKTGGDKWTGYAMIRRVGKTRAGRILDGVEHNGFPERIMQ